MIDDEISQISPALAHEIEDTIMFGKPDELKLLIDSTGKRGGLSDDVRQGLESLYYFRTHYGQQPLDDTNKKKVTLMDSAWTMELLNRLRVRSEAAAKTA